VLPVSFDTTMLRPLPQELLGAVCNQCDKTQAVWAMPHATRLGEEAPFVCSLCMLYKSRWALESRVVIDDFITEVEKIVMPFNRTPEGELLDCKDADRILFAIVVENRMHLAKKSVTR